MFVLCSAMDWNHLPVKGGLYDQHPRLLDEWAFIFEQRAGVEKQEREKREREMKRKRK